MNKAEKQRYVAQQLRAVAKRIERGADEFVLLVRLETSSRSHVGDDIRIPIEYVSLGSLLVIQQMAEHVSQRISEKHAGGLH